MTLANSVPSPALLVYSLLWTCHLHPAVSPKSAGHVVLHLGLLRSSHGRTPLGGGYPSARNPGVPPMVRSGSAEVKTILLCETFTLPTSFAMGGGR